MQSLYAVLQRRVYSDLTLPNVGVGAAGVGQDIVARIHDIHPPLMPVPAPLIDTESSVGSDGSVGPVVVAGVERKDCGLCITLFMTAASCSVPSNSHSNDFTAREMMGASRQ